MTAMRAATADLFRTVGSWPWAAHEGDPTRLDFDGFGDRENILKFYAETPEHTVHLGQTEQALNSAKVACPLIDLARIAAPHGVRFNRNMKIAGAL
jgi:hypothetical protein